VPVGHTPFSWTGSGTAARKTPKPPNASGEIQDEDGTSARNGGGTRLGDAAAAAEPDVPADTAAAEPETAYWGDGGGDTGDLAPEARTKVMALHHSGKTAAQIRNHYQLVDYGLTEATVLEIIREGQEEAKAEAATAARASTGLGASERRTGSTREQNTAPKTYSLPELKEWMGCFSKGGDPDRMRELLAHTFSKVLSLFGCYMVTALGH
jgi:hypothetical protein